MCREFLAPQYIDPKFLDPRHVFKDLSSVVSAAEAAASGSILKGTSAANAHANVFAPEKKRRKREGYDEGDYTLYKEIGVGEFIRTIDPVGILGSVNKMTFKEPEEKACVLRLSVPAHTRSDAHRVASSLLQLGQV